MNTMRIKVERTRNDITRELEIAISEETRYSRKLQDAREHIEHLRGETRHVRKGSREDCRIQKEWDLTWEDIDRYSFFINKERSTQTQLLSELSCYKEKANYGKKETKHSSATSSSKKLKKKVNSKSVSLYDSEDEMLDAELDRILEKADLCRQISKALQDIPASTSPQEKMVPTRMVAFKSRYEFQVLDFALLSPEVMPFSQAAFGKQSLLVDMSLPLSNEGFELASIPLVKGDVLIPTLSLPQVYVPLLNYSFNTSITIFIYEVLSREKNLKEARKEMWYSNPPLHRPLRPPDKLSNTLDLVSGFQIKSRTDFKSFRIYSYVQIIPLSFICSTPSNSRFSSARTIYAARRERGG